jgi:nicotinamidase-related amidase
VVLVIDMLRGFLEEGYPLYIGKEARNIIPNIQGLLERELARESKIFFVCDNHDPDDLEFKMFPPHCIAGTAEAEVIPELSKYPGEIIPKKRYSAFFNTNLDEVLKNIKSDKLIVCGVLTDICVMHTIADARNRDYNAEVPIDCVAALDKKTQQFALDHIDKVLGARLTRFKEAHDNG